MYICLPNASVDHVGAAVNDPVAITCLLANHTPTPNASVDHVGVAVNDPVANPAFTLDKELYVSDGSRSDGPASSHTDEPSEME